MRSIEIDFDVHKRIEMERTSFAETPNAVLRRLLGIDDAGRVSAATSDVGRPWIGKGVTLPHGSELKMEYNGLVYCGHIISSIWVVEGQSFRSPSAAASGLARTKKGKLTTLDGWMYWTVRRPGDIDWIRLAHLRPRDQPLQQPSSTEPQEEQMPVHSDHDLLTEAAVTAELEAFLARQSDPVEPSWAYRVLADCFGLSEEQRRRTMPDGRVHWENRVQWARRKLNDAAKLDRSVPRGLWALKH
jgi:hypothetical protein